MHFICICCQASPSLLHLLTKPPSVVAPLSVSAAKLLRPCLYFLHMLMKQAWGLLLPHNFPQDYSLWWTKREPLAGIWTDVLIIIGFEISETSSAGSLRASLSLIMRTPVYPLDKGIWRTSLTHPKSPSLSVAEFQEWANTPSLNDVDFQKSDLQYSNLSK